MGIFPKYQRVNNLTAIKKCFLKNFNFILKKMSIQATKPINEQSHDYYTYQFH